MHICGSRSLPDTTLQVTPCSLQVTPCSLQVTPCSLQVTPCSLLHTRTLTLLPLLPITIFWDDSTLPSARHRLPHKEWYLLHPANQWLHAQDPMLSSHPHPYPCAYHRVCSLAVLQLCPSTGTTAAALPAAVSVSAVVNNQSDQGSIASGKGPELALVVLVALHSSHFQVENWPWGCPQSQRNQSLALHSHTDTDHCCNCANKAWHARKTQHAPARAPNRASRSKPGRAFRSCCLLDTDCALTGVG